MDIKRGPQDKLIIVIESSMDRQLLAECAARSIVDREVDLLPVSSPDKNVLDASDPAAGVTTLNANVNTAEYILELIEAFGELEGRLKIGQAAQQHQIAYQEAAKLILLSRYAEQVSTNLLPKLQELTADIEPVVSSDALPIYVDPDELTMEAFHATNNTPPVEEI